MEMEQKKPKKKIIMIVAAVVAAILVVGYLTTVYAAAPNEEEGSLLREYPVTRGDITAGTDGSGSLVLEGKPQNFPAPVKLDEVNVKAGDTVKKGDVLARASRSHLEQKLHELEIELKKAEIALDNAKNNKKEKDISSSSDGGAAKLKAEYDAKQTQLQAGANGVSANLANMEARVAEINARIAEIDAQLAALNQDAAAPDAAAQPVDAASLEQEKADLLKEKEELEASMAGARSELAAATDSINQLENEKNAQLNEIYVQNGKDQQVNALQADTLNNAVTSAQMDVDEKVAAIEKVKELLQSLELRAEQDGIVLEVNYAAGAETTEDKAVASIGDPAGLYARLQVSQADIGDIEEGQEVELRFDAFSEIAFKGSVLRKIPTPVKDSNPVAYYVDVLVDAEDTELLSGMTCSGQFIIKQKKDVLMLSNKAIKSVDGRQVVLLRDENGELFEQEIEAGFSDGKFSEILSGLTEGQTVFVEG
ncbi:MAG: HlyD family efflux transporter periplasmic adaptor subunit [Christensenellaceae bacterium]|jgi:HlyD family secretion protein